MTDFTIEKGMVRRPWTAEDDAHLRKFHAEGWKDADIGYIMGRRGNVVFRHRSALGLKPNGTPGPVRGTYKHSDETRAKIRAAQLQRWQEDEQYRRAVLPKLQQGRVTNQAKRWHVPADLDDLKHYKKMRALYGAEYARSAIEEITSAKASPAE